MFIDLNFKQNYSRKTSEAPVIRPRRIRTKGPGNSQHYQQERQAKPKQNMLMLLLIGLSPFCFCRTYGNQQYCSYHHGDVKNTKKNHVWMIHGSGKVAAHIIGDRAFKVQNQAHNKLYMRKCRRGRSNDIVKLRIAGFE